MELILASKSPRRIEILKNKGYEFEIIPAVKDEILDGNLNPEENVLNLAKHKALEVFNNHQDKVILGADTIVVYQNEIFGKPKDFDDAFRMLKLLQGNKHYVMTGVSILSSGFKQSFVVKSVVKFKEMTDLEIKEYIKTGEPMDKAGSYAIQGLASKYIDFYEGSYDNIVGLPIEEVDEVLKRYNKSCD